MFSVRRFGSKRASPAPTSILVLTLAAALVVAVAATAVATTALAPPALASDPSPGASPLLIDPLDPRAGPEANQVGAPLLAALAVLVVGVLAVATTAAYVRLTRRR